VFRGHQKTDGDIKDLDGYMWKIEGREVETEDYTA
jgi:hypothetical protein